MTMPFTLYNYNKLCAAIATGATEVQFSDRKVIYRSLREMLQIKTIMEKSLGLNTKPSDIYPKTSKGL